MSILILSKKKRFVVVSVIAIFLTFGAFFFSKSINNKPKDLNIILIVVDALRSDHLGCYGYERNTSPNIDRLAKDGVKFTQAISAGGWTIESVPSILTGAYSPAHHITQWSSSLNPRIETLAQKLTITGYECIFWSNHGVFIKLLNVNQGFCKVFVMRRFEKKDEPNIADHVFTNKIIKWLKKWDHTRPFFFYIHYEGCHAPYRPPAPYKDMYLNTQNNRETISVPISSSSFEDEKYIGYCKIPYMVAENNITDPNYYITQYDGAISYTDVQIGRLLGALKDLGLDKKTLIILTSDHGESLGEHNSYFYHTGCYEENIRVPLIIRYPRLFPKGKVISKQVSLIDIAPTISELLNIKKSLYMRGESLLALMKHWRRYNADYVLSFTKEDYVLRSEYWKLYCKGKLNSWEFYNLKSDPKEQYNLSDKNSIEFKEMRKVLKNLIFRMESNIENDKKRLLSDKDKEYLRSLGYAN